MSLSRRGLGLLEAVVSLALTGVLAALTSRMLLTTAFRLRDRSERMAEETALRVTAGGFRAAFESLGHDSATGVDLLSLGATSVRLRAGRAAGVVCSAGTGLLVVRADTMWWRALRDPVPSRDTILVGRLDTPAWQVFPLQASPGPTLCPDGTRAIALPVATPLGALTGIAAGSPLLVYEAVELRHYSAAPDYWVGMRLLGTAQPVQPFAGPMSAQGLALVYQRRDGTPALLPSEVAAVEVRLEARTERAGGVGLVRGPPSRPDSLSIFVSLVNPP